MLGQRLGNRYEIVSELGRGGMGVVYRARDPLLNRDVAVKLIPPSLLSPQAEERFQREAQLVAQMNHPGIVSIFDIGRHEGALYFLMPVVQGTNLRAFLSEKPRTVGQLLDIIIQVAEALEYSHARGVIHRDIKPENIMVTEEVGAARVWVMDFGLAKSTGDQRLTKTGTMVGTVSYFSPEQVLAKEIDHRTDIYALGTVLYEALAGEPPFVGEMQAVIYRVVHEIPRPLKDMGVDIGPQLQGIIDRTLSKDPAKRYANAGELAQDLRRYQSSLQSSEREKSIVVSTMMTAQWNRVAIAPFVGRDKEFAELQRKLNAAIDGESQFVVVAGEPGIGKTRLLEELENLARAKKVRVLHGRFAEQTQAFAYQGFRDVIQEYFRGSESSSGERPDFADLASDLISVFPQLSEISEIRNASSSESVTAEPSKPDDRTWVFELIARTFTRIGNGKPLMVVFENLHAAEMSLDAISYLVQRLGNTPTLICGTYRQSEIDRRHPLVKMLDAFRGDPHFSSMTLGPLSASEHLALVESVVGSQKLSGDLARRLFDATEANPFFTKELIRSLLDGGAISRDETGAWTLSGEAAISSDALPETIQQTVEKRIERLPEELREVLSTASVIGKSFEFDDLETLAEGKGDVGKIIDRLVTEGLIEEERESRGDRLTFSSGIVRDVLYNALSRRGRRSLHRRYAEFLEERNKGRLERALPQLVLHYSEGDVPEKTVEYGLALARKSLASFSAEEAIHVLKTVLEFLKEDDWSGDRSLAGEARMLLATAYKLQGNLEAALREAEGALRVFEREKLEARTLEACIFAAENSWNARRVEDAQRWTARGLDAARSANAPEVLARFLSLAATLAHLRGEYDLSNEYLEEMERLAPQQKAQAVKEEIPRGGNLRVALSNPVAATEPALIETDEEVEVLSLVFEPPMTFDERGHLVPLLCESWETSEDGRSFFFNLRSDVRFHDGTPMVAADLKDSFERSIRRRRREMKPAFALIRGVTAFHKGEAEQVEGIIVHSEHRLEVRTEEALPIYPSFLTETAAAATRQITAADGSVQVVGTGPFRIKERSRERVVLEANRQYWRGHSAAVDEIEFRVFPDPSVVASLLRSGEIDVARDLPPHDFDDILRDARFRTGLVEAAKKNTYFIIFNSVGAKRGDAPEVRLDPAARRALLGTLRVRESVWQTLGRLAQPASSLIPPGILGHDAGRKRVPVARDDARQILLDRGFELPLTLRAAVHPLFLNRYRSFTDAILQSWAEIGVQVVIETTGMESYLARFGDSSSTDLIIGRWNADYEDPDNFAHGLFDSQTGAFNAWFHSSETDALLDEARGESRPSVRESLYRRFENRLFEEGDVLPLFHDIDYRIGSPKVRGLQLRGSAPYVNYTEIGLSADEGSSPAMLRPTGGVIHIPMPETVATVDPALINTNEEGELASTMFETLTRIDGVRVVPWLAASMTPEEGGSRYRVILRDEVRFHDGRRLTARDVRYSWERALAEGTRLIQAHMSSIVGGSAIIEGRTRDLEGFRIISNREFLIDLTVPISFFPAIVSFPAAAIVPEGMSRFDGSWRDGVVGTGPYRMVQFQPHRELELERNPHYWRPGLPKNEGLIFHLGASPEQIKSQFVAGRYSVAHGLYPADVEALRQDPQLASAYREIPRLSIYFVAFNRRRGPLTDVALRRRLTQAIDVPATIRRTLGRVAIPAHGVIPPGLLGNRPTPPPTGQRESGELDIELTAAVNPTYFGQYSALMDDLLTTWKRIGVKVKIVTSSMDQFVQAEDGGTTDISVSRWISDYPDSDTFAFNLLHSESGSIGKLVGGPDLDRPVTAARVELDPHARNVLYRQMEDILWRESLILPLFHEQVYRFARPEVEGLALNFSVPEVCYEQLRVVR
jgi:ABC-type transport system substrate-binding protein